MSRSAETCVGEFGFARSVMILPLLQLGGQHEPRSHHSSSHQSSPSGDRFHRMAVVYRVQPMGCQHRSGHSIDPGRLDRQPVWQRAAPPAPQLISDDGDAVRYAFDTLTERRRRIDTHDQMMRRSDSIGETIHAYAFASEDERLYMDLDARPDHVRIWLLTRKEADPKKTAAAGPVKCGLCRWQTDRHRRHQASRP
jgi:hypothetical protein